LALLEHVYYEHWRWWNSWDMLEPWPKGRIEEIDVARVNDVAAHILLKLGPMTAMKLQKLVYYSQAWHLVWEEEPLFPERIEAWANGPVSPALYERHRGLFTVASPWAPGDPGRLTAKERSTVDGVLEFYGPKSAQWLSDLAHSEEPWRLARTGMKPGVRGNREITHAAMAEYYEAIASEA
jgi:uncharacterized phage-associated protein